MSVERHAYESGLQACIGSPSYCTSNRTLRQQKMHNGKRDHEDRGCSSGHARHSEKFLDEVTAHGSGHETYPVRHPASYNIELHTYGAA